MRNKLLLILLAVIVIVVSGLAIYQFKFKHSIEDDLNKLRSMKSYSTDVSYTFKNYRTEFKEEGKQYYNEKYGMKLNVGDKEQIYKEDKIFIRYPKDNKSYEVSPDYDNFYRYTFVNELNKFLVPGENTKYKYDTHEGKKCIVVEFENLNGNENMSKEILFVDASKLVPLEINIFNKKGDDKVTVYFKNFSTSGTVQKEIFD
ncbi:Outer membrane lipoprotein-sorting protein [Clostridium cavendishii DSM 21758]|uniref:Outer membrane lipoprotein-sorting protein n=1 Tax=Clostridium cavendishii DSM 21758 TaxID=1121302 RepID=A0A1M6TTU7_9CLOT|nr:germination lipoprotein GerS-related protein [Clostridium cavendishii]SHK60344.1 Outer membrane lipoprotein-sorting protein [Clostridium cavendishii DSM 21758]